MVRADSHLDDRFSLSPGIFIASRDTDTRLDGTTEDGTDLDFEGDLGLDSSTSVFRLDGYYRFNSRHRLDLSVFDFSRDGSKRIQEDIQWGDYFFNIDTVVKVDDNLTIYKAAYTYSFLQREQGYIGASVGLHVLDTRVSLSIKGLGDGDRGEVTAPLPVIGLRGQYDFGNRWTFRASSEFFFVEIDDVEGSLTDLYAGFDFAINDTVSIGLGLNSVILDVEAANSGFSGTLESRYTGGLLFLMFNF
jgi:hypothetical protein